MKEIINVNGNDVSLIVNNIGEDDYISITDIAKYKNSDAPADIIKNWLRNKDTIEFLGLWERLSNDDFKLVEFDQFRNNAGSNSFVLSPKKWIKETGAIGLISKSGRYGGTYAHKDIAFEFASWISAEFKLYLIKEYQLLKKNDNRKGNLEWNVHRTLSKVNYKIHTDAIKENLIPPDIPKNKIGITYASEADLLNVALFGLTAKEWREQNNDKKGNMRDYATIEQLLILANIESFNAHLINYGVSQGDRLVELNQMAKTQMKSLINKSNELLSKS